MSEDRGREILLITFMFAIGMVTWTEIHVNKTAPRPSRFVGAGMVWGILGLIAPLISYQVVAMFGIGMDLALLYNYYQGVNSTPSPEGVAPEQGAEPATTPQPEQNLPAWAQQILKGLGPL